jgi:hypothetical protein
VVTLLALALCLMSDESLVDIGYRLIDISHKMCGLSPLLGHPSYSPPAVDIATSHLVG